MASLNCDGHIDCTSLSFSYDIMGRVTVSYTTFFKVSSVGSPSFCYTEELVVGERTFTGEVTSMSLNQIIGTENWYETHVTLLTTTEE